MQCLGYNLPVGRNHSNVTSNVALDLRPVDDVATAVLKSAVHGQLWAAAGSALCSTVPSFHTLEVGAASSRSWVPTFRGELPQKILFVWVKISTQRLHTRVQVREQVSEIMEQLGLPLQSVKQNTESTPANTVDINICRGLQLTPVRTDAAWNTVTHMPVVEAYIQISG